MAAAVAAAAMACETRPASTSRAEETSAAARNPAGAARNPAGAARNPAGAARNPAGAARNPAGAARNPAEDDIDATLPAAVQVRAVGTVEPAPWLHGAERVAVLRGRHGAFVIAAGTGWLRVFTPRGERVAEAAGDGAAHVLEVMDLDRDGQAEIVVGRGISREALQAPPSVAVYGFDGRALAGPRTVPLPETSRAQIIGAALSSDSATPGRLWIGSFDSKYHATLLEANIDMSAAATVAPATRTLGRVRVPMALASGDPDGQGGTELFVARPYGDSLEEPGDVFILSHGGARSPLPSTRGARAVAVHGRDVVYADGWHREYARKGRALITRARWQNGAYAAEILVRVADRHGYDRLRIGDVDGDGAPDAVAAGNGPAVLVRGLEPVTGPVPALGDVEARDVYVADIDGKPGDEVVIAGPAPGIWRFAE